MQDFLTVETLKDILSTIPPETHIVTAHGRVTMVYTHENTIMLAGQEEYEYDLESEWVDEVIWRADEF